MKRNQDTISREQLLQSGGLALLGATSLLGGAASASLSAETAHDHSHHARKYGSLAQIAADCARAGRDCVDHCLVMLKSGDNSLARCAEVAQEMVVMCEALTAMASYESPHLKKLARLCIDVCRDCEKECRKHENKHRECRLCREHCEKCIAACRKV